MHNWIKMRKESDFSFLFKDREKHRKELSINEKIILNEYYLDIITEFFSEFGVNKKYVNELKLMREITLLNIEYIQTNDAFLLNTIETLKFKLDQLKMDNVDKELSIDSDKQMKEQIAAVGSTLGKPVDIMNITVLQFYTQMTALKYSSN